MLVAGHVMTADEMERIIFSEDATEIASTNCPTVIVSLSTLKWWRELVDLNPGDLAPRMDERIRECEALVERVHGQRREPPANTP